MEIRVEQRVSGHEFRRQILARYGGREHLVAAAAAGGSVEARVDLRDLRALEDRPRRLDAQWTLGAVGDLEPADLAAFTPRRMELLAQLERLPGKNVSQLATLLGRDKKNVSRDLQALGRLGLVRMERKGRQAIPILAGDEVHIVIEAGPRKRPAALLSSPSAASQRRGRHPKNKPQGRPRKNFLGRTA